MDNSNINTIEQLTENISNLKLSFQKLNNMDYLNSIKMDVVAKYLTEHKKNPKATKKEICKKIDISPPLLNRYLKHLGMEKLIRPKKPPKKSNMDMPQTTKSKKKNVFGGGMSKDIDSDTNQDPNIENKIYNAFK